MAQSKKSFAVIGLGQFGISVVEELVGNGMDVIAIDNDEEAVKKISSLLPTVAVANATDEESLKELGIKDVDSAIVAFGSHIEASILTTVILKESVFTNDNGLALFSFITDFFNCLRFSC